MPLFLIIILALVQGITEFLPISSSGHLILVAEVSGQDQGLLLDVAVHVGTLGAVVAYFWRDLLAMLVGVAGLAKGRISADARLAGTLVVASIPAALVGLLAKDFIEASLRSPAIIAWTTVIFGVLLYIADKVGMTIRRIGHVGLAHALLLGLAQVLSLVPGTSRSGVTMTAARLLGYERADAARYSMLMSIPIISGAGLLLGLDIAQAEHAALGADVVLAVLLSFGAALGAIALLMAWVTRVGFTPFVVYRLLLGAVLFYWVYG